MTRDEEVITACKGFLSRYPSIDQAGLSIGFLDGAVWADKHPKNVWHDAIEMPERSSCEILYEIRSDNGFEVTYIPEGLTAGNWDNVLKVLGMTRWAYIKDLLPKGGEE